MDDSMRPGKSVRFSVPQAQRFRGVDADASASDGGDDFDEDEYEEEYEEDDYDVPTYPTAGEMVPAVDAAQVPVNINSMPTNTLLQMAPHEIRELFDERVAYLELEVDNSKEKIESLDWEWRAKYKELDVRCGVKDTEIDHLKKENSELKQKVSQYKRNLWMKSLDLEAIKLVEDEVKLAMSAHEREIGDIKAVHEEVAKAMRDYHDKNLKEFRAEIKQQLHDAEEGVLQKALMRSDPDADVLKHQSVADPLDILKSLRRLHIGLYEKVYNCDDRAHLTVILDRYRAKERALVEKHIGKTPREEGDEHRQAQEDEIRAGKAERTDLLARVDELQQTVAAAVQHDQEAAIKRAMSGGAGDDADGEVEVLSEALAKAAEICATLAAALRSHDEKRGEDEEKRRPTGTGELVFEDKVFVEALQTSRFAKQFEEVLRENERLKARLYVVGDGAVGTLNLGALEEKKAQLSEEVDHLLARSDRLNLQCRTLEDQKHGLKQVVVDAAKEAEEAAALLPKERARRHRNNISQATAYYSDSDLTDSISEDYSDDDDMYNPADDMPMEQIAGVEPVIEEPEEEELPRYEVEKKQFTATMRKEGHVASLVEQILQYLETGTPFYILKHGQVIKFFAYLANNRSVINICSYHEGIPNRKAVTEIIMLRDIKQITMGQYSDSFKRLLKSSGGSNKVTDPNDLHLVPRDTEKVETYNTGTYFYRSFSLKMRGGRTISAIAHSDNDYETWIVAMHRITTIDPRYGRALDTVPFMKGYEDLLPEERDFCEQHHTPPLLYLNAKMQCLKQEYKLFLTLYDIRTLSGFDLMHSQKVFELWLSLTWCEKQLVYQIRYLEQFPHEASNLIAIIDQQQQKEAKKEAERLMKENTRHA